jgi:hypothetical protein
MNILKELVPPRDRHTPLQDARRGVLVQLTFDEGE